MLLRARLSRHLSALHPTLVLGLCVFASSASAQPVGGHGVIPGPRPLQARLMLADAVVVAEIDAVALGRIDVSNAVPLVGDVGGAFRLKRSPSRPFGFEPASRALLLLRGARSPYVLVDEEREIVFLDAEADALRWQDAVRSLWQHRSQPGALLELYASWLEGPASDLREEALRGLGDRDAPFHPLPEPFLADRVRTAMRGDRPADVRSAAASAAVLGPEGTELLLESLSEPGDTATSEVVTIALRSGLLQRRNGVRAALLRSLQDPNPGVRRAALAFTPRFSQEQEVLEAVDRIASADPEPETRSAAERTRKKLRRTNQESDGE